MKYQMRNWYHFVWLCGDNICEQHVHDLDVCNWAKNDHPVEANGMGYCVQHTARPTRRPKARSTTCTSWSSPTPMGRKMHSQCRQIPGCFNSVSEYAVGTTGRVQLQRPHQDPRRSGVDLPESARRQAPQPLRPGTHRPAKGEQGQRTVHGGALPGRRQLRRCWAAWPPTPARSSSGTTPWPWAPRNRPTPSPGTRRPRPCRTQAATTPFRCPASTCLIP